MDSNDSIRFMKIALRRAKCAADCGEAPVGCVIVCDGVVVATGRNMREKKNNALMHAELIAIDRACRKLGRWRLWDCDLFVTLEPCPMCAGAIINSRIRRVVFGCTDPKAGSFGSVADFALLAYNHTPEVTGGVLSDECSLILSEFFKQLREKKKTLPE